MHVSQYTWKSYFHSNGNNESSEVERLNLIKMLHKLVIKGLKIYQTTLTSCTTDTDKENTSRNVTHYFGEKKTISITVK